MEEAAAVRRATVAAVDDVDPTRLNDRLRAHLDDGSMAPGAFALRCAQAVLQARSGDTDLPSGLPKRAAGVQLIYDGLRLTRDLAQSEPWDHGEDEAANLDVLIADILVARGFYLLARTDAADDAVAVVRAFGRDQTTRRVTDDPSLDGNLERDVFELAAVAGTSAVGGHAPTGLRQFATDLSTERPLPPAERLLSGEVADRLAALVGPEPQSGEGVRTSADH
jgi:hypothetical protein